MRNEYKALKVSIGHCNINMVSPLKKKRGGGHSGNTIVQAQATWQLDRSSSTTCSSQKMELTVSLTKRSSPADPSIQCSTSVQTVKTHHCILGPVASEVLITVLNIRG